MKRKIIAGFLLILLVPTIIYFVFPGPLYTFFILLDRKSANLSSKSIRVDDHTVYYLEGGSGDTILLVHGFSANKDNWNKFAAFLTDKYHVISIDLPGHGESSKLVSSSYTIANQVKWLNTFVTQLALKKIHIVGNSMGGTIAGRFAILHPGKVRTLGLFNSAGIQSAKKSELTIAVEKGNNFLLLKKTDDYDSLLGYLFVKQPAIPGNIKAFLAEQAIKSKTFNAKIFKDIMDEYYFLEPELSKIQAKTLILWGDTDRLIDVSAAGILHKEIADSSLVIMKACGHVPMLERPGETARHYLKFLNKQK